MTASPLAQEIAFYRANHARLMETSLGQFVVIKAESIVGVFADESSAFAEGYSRFGNTPFLVKQVAEGETVLNFTSFTVAY